ncbi:hypothetical protein BH18GEM1_BH18GEM1_21660 [soil metagenome]
MPQAGPSVTRAMRTDELLRRIDGLDDATLGVCEKAGWVVPEIHLGGEDPRWWSDADLNRLSDIVRFHRRGLTLEEAWRRAQEDRFFGLCPCDWR